MFRVDFFWIILLFFFVFPMIKQWSLERSRVMAIRNLEKKTGKQGNNADTPTGKRGVHGALRQELH